MEVKVSLVLLALGLLLLSLPGLHSQQLVFKHGIQRYNSSGGQGSWTAAGTLKLSDEDMIVFDPKVTLQMVTDFCTINLRSCSPDGQTSPTPTGCYCTRTSEDQYNLFVNSQDSPTHKDLELQATVPSRYLFDPLALTATVGELARSDNDGGLSSFCSGQIEELKKAFEEERRKESKKLDEMKTQLAISSGRTEELQKAFEEERRKESKKIDEMKTQLANQSSEIAELTRVVETLTTQLVSQNTLITALAPTTCADVQGLNPRPVVKLSSGLDVMCDTATDHGGWVVFQRRFSDAESFYRNWTDYEVGFGDLRGNFWLGLENIYKLALGNDYELRVDLVFNGKKYYARYDKFTLLGESENYTMYVSGYSGDAGESMFYHNGSAFTTKDRDNDRSSDGNCANVYYGAWWYRECHHANLNGLWGSKAYGQGVIWRTTTTYYDSASFTEMKMKPRKSRLQN